MGTTPVQELEAITFDLLLWRARTNSGCTKRWFGRWIGTDDGQIRKWEKAKTVPTALTMEKIIPGLVRVTGVPAEQWSRSWELSRPPARPTAGTGVGGKRGPKREIPLGTRFGRLVTTGDSYTVKDANYSRFVDTKCDCGNLQANRVADLLKGDSRSCGCLKRERQIAKGKYHGSGAGAPRVETDAEELRHLYEDEEWSLEKIAHKLRCSSGTILNRLVERDIPRRDCAWKTAGWNKIALDRELVRHLYVDEGWLTADIGREVGCSPPTLLQKMREWGVYEEWKRERLAKHRVKAKPVNRAKVSAYNRQYRLDHLDEIQARTRRNREHINAKQRERRRQRAKGLPARRERLSAMPRAFLIPSTAAAIH